MYHKKMNRYERAYIRRKQRLSGNRDVGNRDFIRLLFMSLFPKRKRVKKNMKKNKHKDSVKKSGHDIRKSKSKKRIKLESKKGKDIKNKTVKKTKSRKVFSFFRFLFVSAGILILLGATFFLIWFSTLEIPDVDNFESRKISNSTKIYDKSGEILLYDIHKDIRRTVVESDEIAQSAKDAIIAIEDHTFYEHKGVVISSTIRAITQTLLSKLGLSSEGTAGGSTLTQQVIKNTLLTRERNITRKAKEWFLAYKIEQKLSKDKILTIYLNEAPYGGTIYGIEEASHIFFGKTAKDVTIAESAYLAAIPNLPTFYSPYGQNREALNRRQRIILSEMKRYGFINDKEYREALEEEVIFLPKNTSGSKALHFVQYVRSYLEQKYGPDMVENGGLRVITTLDYKLQQQAEEIIEKHVDEVEGLYDASNAALVAVENETGQIITMVGSRSYYDTNEFDGNFNVSISPRQPGSSFKPFAYAAAFEKGLYPESVVFDTQTQFNSRCEKDDFTSEDGCYGPKNYDAQFNGPMTVRNALAQSRNIPAVKIAHLAGIPNILSLVRQMGISSLVQGSNFYGLGLVLGGGEVSLLEMVSAYTTFPNDGRRMELNPILEIKNQEGNILESFFEKEYKVFSKNTARMVNSILSDNEARTPLFGSRSFLYFGNKDVAGKTGTTNDNRDAWLIGYSDDVSVGVWTGNNDNTPMKKGSSISGKPWREYMDLIIDQYGDNDFKLYDLPENLEDLPFMVNGEWQGGESYTIDTLSGLLATEFTPEENRQRIVKFDPHTLLHYVSKDKLDVSNDNKSDSQYENWEYGVQAYVEENYQDLLEQDFNPPTEYDNIHTENGAVELFDFDIDKLDSVYEEGAKVRFDVDLDDIRKSEIALAQVFVNNAFMGELDSDDLDFSFDLDDIIYRSADNFIRVVIIDNDGNMVSRLAEFRVE